MTAIETLLKLAARNGRLLLVAGLLAGVFWQQAALFLKPLIPEMVVLMLFLSAVRIGYRAAFGAVRDQRFALGAVIAFQVILPLCLIGLFRIAGIGGLLGTACILVTAGSSISGAPNLAILCKADPAPALRLLVIGTALLPVTVIPVFWLESSLQAGSFEFAPALGLFLVIALATLAGFSCRALVNLHLTAERLPAIDGLLAIVMMVIVVGLMSAVGPALRSDPGLLVETLIAAFAINFGLQILAFATLRSAFLERERVPFAIVAGNRNIALFLTVLPVSITDPLLLFIGCYQIPMYLTPLLLGPVYEKLAKKGGGQPESD